MNRGLPAALLALLVLAPPALAGERVERTLDADPGGVVQVRNERGTVRIRGWDEPRVAVSGTLDSLARGLRLVREDDVTTLEVVMPDRALADGEGSALEVRVPAGSRVDFSGVSSAIDLAGIAGGSALNTVSGDVTLADWRGAATIESVSGHVRVTDARGEQARGGESTAAPAVPELRVSTVSGDADLNLATIGRLSARSVSGKLAVSGELGPQGRIAIETITGDSTLTLRGRIDARLAVRTGPGGKIVNGLDAQAPRTEMPAKQRLESSLGSGSGEIAIATLTGTVRLARN